MSGTARVAGPPPELINSTKISTGVPVAVSALAMDSVDGQRARPEAVMRLDLLKVVGSSPARRAKPEADSPARAARRSTADQTCAWVSMTTPRRLPPGAPRLNPRRHDRNILAQPSTPQHPEERLYRRNGAIRRWTL